MSDLTAFHRPSDASRFTELPDHLRYRPAAAPNPCPNVLPRYLMPRASSPATPRPTFQPQMDFGVLSKPRPEPRYLSPRARTPDPRPPAKYTELPEYQYHLRVAAAAGFANATPKLLAYRETAGKTEQESPRQAAARHREENKKILNWRSVATNAPSRTFDEIRQRNQQLAAALEAALAAKAAKNKTPSLVADYCRHGTPIKHHTTGEHYVSKRKKDFDPKWTGGGGAGGGKWTRGNGDKGPVNKSIVRCDSRVKEYRAASRERQVPRGHVPRVATLSPSYSLQRWESEVAQQNQGGADSTPLSRQASEPTTTTGVSPAPRQPSFRKGAHDSSSPAAEAPPPSNVEVIEGPVTVSVPKGAVVRISTSQQQHPQ